MLDILVARRGFVLGFVGLAHRAAHVLVPKPFQTVFLIVSSEPGRLLPTIRSRCRRLVLEGLGHEDVRRAVRQAYEAEDKTAPGDKDIDQLEPLAGGSVRRMLSLAGSGGIQLQARIEKIFSNLPNLDLVAAHQLADELQPAAAEQKFELFFDLLFGYMARLVRAAATGDGAGGEIALAQRLIGPARVATFVQLWETLARDKADAQSLNLDRKSFILDALSRMAAAAKS